VKRDWLFVIGAVTVVAAAAGCSSDTKTSGPSSSSASTSAASSATPSGAATGSPTASGASGETKVIVGGQPQNAGGPVVCSMTNGKFSIAIGDMLTGVIVGLEQDGSVVHNAGLGTIDGVVISFAEGAPGNNATATKSGSSYKITGNATGVDNAGQQVTKSFEVDATCP